MTETNTDRRPTWQRVRGGDLLHAGQPYRLEYGDECSVALKATRDATAVEGIIETTSVAEVAPRGVERFVDSSWKPPLVLPTEPTWGIAVYFNTADGNRYFWAQKLHVDGDQLLGENHSNWSIEKVTDFIPLTDEQVARIEAVR